MALLAVAQELLKVTGRTAEERANSARQLAEMLAAESERKVASAPNLALLAPTPEALACIITATDCMWAGVAAQAGRAAHSRRSKDGYRGQ